MSKGRRAYRGLRGALGLLLYAPLAHAWGLPGLGVRTRIAALAGHVLRFARGRVRSTQVYDMFCFPMDSTRYFEFDFMWRRLEAMPVRHYLDVSSPRLLPLVFLQAHPEVAATLLNPDEPDLQQTRALVEASGMSGRCALHASTIGEMDLPAASFDVVTCISVLEHIRDDVEALRRMWAAVRPGGRLLLSLPCAARGEEQFLNIRTYAFAPVEADGRAFHQYVYDEPMLERLLAVTGRPAQMEVYGERKAGTHLRMYERKWIDGDYPFWKEPWFMALAFRRVEAIRALPGEGVVMMEFVR